MPHLATGTVLEYLRSLAGPDTLRELPDNQLLERVAAFGDEAAFALLVQRHGPLVWRVCRRLLRRPQDAEDAFQATFLVLVRKAGAIRRPQLLSNWLFGVARRIAAKAGVRIDRRNAWEMQAPADLETRGVEASHPCILGRVLDDEVSRLPAKYRVPFVLCYLEGLTNEEAARRLGRPKGTLQSQLAWARARLRQRLTEQGFAEPAGILAGALTPGADPLSADVIQRTVGGGLVFGKWIAASDATISARSALLAQGVLHAMFVTKLKMISLCAGVIFFLGAGVGLWINASPVAASLPQVIDDSVNTDTLVLAEAPDQADRPTVKEVITRDFKTGGAPQVKVEVVNGSVTLTASDQKDVHIRVTKQAQAPTDEEAMQALNKLDVQINQEGDRIRVTAKQKERQTRNANASAAVEIQVPLAAVLDLQTTNGSITTTGGTGIAQLRSVNGSIQAKETKGPLQASTTNGKITVSGVTGKLDATTTNGTIVIQGDQAFVKAQTVNGSIDWKGSLAAGINSFQSTNGSIKLMLPKSSQFKIDAQSSLGSVSTDFPLTKQKKSGRKVLQGNVGDKPAFDLHLKTSNGSISVKQEQ
jgi:RNA polymerase sigma factor (sigma-70 family)